MLDCVSFPSQSPTPFAPTVNFFFRPAGLFLLGLAAPALVLTSCESIDPSADAAPALQSDWWSLPWDDAANQRTESVELASGVRVAARSIKVLSRDESEVPVSVSAKGNALVQTSATTPIRALGYQVDVIGASVSVKGSPVAVQGKTRLLSTSPETVITIDDEQLGVVGPAKFDAVDSGPPTTRTKSAPVQSPAAKPAAAPTPKPAPAAKPPTVSKPVAKPAPVPAKPVPAAAPKPKAPAPAQVTPPAPASAPAPKLPQMRLPDDEDLPIPGSGL